MAEQRREIGRLALRHEGKLWVAYWAPRQDSMVGAQYLGSILMTLVERSPDRKAGFIALMQEALGDAVAYATGGTRPDWNTPRPAPEHERSGHG